MLFQDESIWDDLLNIETMLATQGSPDKGCGLHTAGPALTNIMDFTGKWGDEAIDSLVGKVSRPNSQDSSV